MKKLIFTFLLFGTITAQTFAQATGGNPYCGNSGPSVCTPLVLDSPGLSPISDSLKPIIDGVANSTVIEFKNFNTLTFQGHALTMDSLTIDTIGNLPAGLCWATSSPTNTFQNQQAGCIRVTGTTNSHPGQYKLYIIVTAATSLGFPITVNADAASLKYFVRVNCSDSAAIVPADTSQTVPYVAYTWQSVCNTGIQTVDQNIQSLNVYPNPFNSQAVVSFNSIKSGMMTEKITSIIGSEVYSHQIDVTVGQNSHVIERNNLSAGVYFYTVSDGTSTFTKRLVITE